MKQDEQAGGTSTAPPKYPHIKVQLSGKDGNAFAIMGRVSAALRKAGVDKAERDAFFAEATAGSYDGVIQAAMKWVNVS